MNPEELAQNLLEKVEKNEDVTDELRSLENIKLKELHNRLETQDARKAFFLNYYNAEAQRLARKYPILHKLKILFILPFLDLANERLSLNTVENGILRSSKRKIKLRNRRFVRIMHLEQADSRIHFALNCASNSCPPIRFYTGKDIDNQLNIATENYLKQEVDIDGKKVSLPRMFKWFSSDFEDIEDFLAEYIEIPEDPQFNYKSFDWSAEVNNFVEE